MGEGGGEKGVEEMGMERGNLGRWKGEGRWRRESLGGREKRGGMGGR